MAQSNMEIVLRVLADTLRTQDIEHLAGLLDQQVVWEGVHPGQRCDGREQALAVLGGFFANRALSFDAVEVIARGDVVVMGIEGPGFNGIPEDFEPSAGCSTSSRCATVWSSTGRLTLTATMRSRRRDLAARCGQGNRGRRCGRTETSSTARLLASGDSGTGGEADRTAWPLRQSTTSALSSRRRPRRGTIASEASRKSDAAGRWPAMPGPDPHEPHRGAELTPAAPSWCPSWDLHPCRSERWPAMCPLGGLVPRLLPHAPRARGGPHI
jgi:hypothetical protein